MKMERLGVVYLLALNAVIVGSLVYEILFVSSWEEHYQKFILFDQYLMLVYVVSFAVASGYVAIQILRHIQE